MLLQWILRKLKWAAGTIPFLFGRVALKIMKAAFRCRVSTSENRLIEGANGEQKKQLVNKNFERYCELDVHIANFNKCGHGTILDRAA